MAEGGEARILVMERHAKGVILLLLLTAFAPCVGQVPTPINEDAEPDCSSHVDPVGATLKHTLDRLLPCKGQMQRSPCVYNTTLTLFDGTQHVIPDIPGCCMVHQSPALAGKLYCSSLRSTQAAPQAAKTLQLLDLVYTCAGGNYSKGPPPAYLNKRDCSSWEVYEGTPICSRRDGSCTCMRGGIPDMAYGCTCTPPNTGAACLKDEQCSGGGKCVGSSLFAQPYVKSGTEESDIERVRTRDGSPVVHAKPVSWFGEAHDGVGLKKSEAAEWQYDYGDGQGWRDYLPRNVLALEQGWREAKATVIVQLDEFDYGDVWASLTEMTQHDSRGRVAAVRRYVRPGAGPPRHDVITVEEPWNLDSEEELRKRTMTP